MKHYINLYAMLENLALLANLSDHKEKIRQHGLKEHAIISEFRTIGIVTPRQSGGTSAALEWYNRNPDTTLFIFKSEQQQRHTTANFNRNPANTTLRTALSKAGMSLTDLLPTLKEIEIEQIKSEPIVLKHVLTDHVKKEIASKDFYKRMHDLFLSVDEDDKACFEEKVTKARQTMALTPTDFVDDKSLTNREFYQKFFIEEVDVVYPERKEIKYVIVDESTSVFAYLGLKRKDFNQWVYDNFGEDVLVIHVD